MDHLSDGSFWEWHKPHVRVLLQHGWNEDDSEVLENSSIELQAKGQLGRHSQQKKYADRKVEVIDARSKETRQHDI